MHAKILHLGPEIRVGPTFSVMGYEVNPYAIGGGGFYWTHMGGGTATLANNSTVAVGSADNYNGGWNIGGGVTINLPQQWSVGFDVRRQDVVYKHGTDITWVTPAIRITLLFS
jgi:opacity protein-like surface antigen